MITHTTMPIDDKLMTLVQWLSPAFPTGAFAYSQGVETAIAEGWITDADSLRNWLKDCLLSGSGRTDAIWVRLAYGADNVTRLNGLAGAFAISNERLREAERQGAAFVKTANAVWGFGLPPLLLPVAVGHTAGKVGLDLEATVALYLQAFVSNLVSAAVRLAPIGQTAGQKVLRDLSQDCLTVVGATRNATTDDVFSNTFLSDVAAMRHETLEPRLFQS